METNITFFYNKTKLFLKKLNLLSFLKKIKVRILNLRSYTYFFYKNFPKNITKSKIPNVLFTSYCCSKNDPIIKEIIQKWANLNRDFEVKYFSDADLELFFLKHNNYYSTYKKLKNGVAKSDFFRIIYLNIYGGYWFDIDLSPSKVVRPYKGNIHLFDMGAANISYMFIGGAPNKLFDETIKKVSININNNFTLKKDHILDITGPRVIQSIVSEKIGFNLKDGEFKGTLKNKTYLEKTEYEFEYMKQVIMDIKSDLYNKLQKKYNKKAYQEYNFI